MHTQTCSEAASCLGESSMVGFLAPEQQKRHKTVNESDSFSSSNNSNKSSSMALSSKRAENRRLTPSPAMINTCRQAMETCGCFPRWVSYEHCYQHMPQAIAHMTAGRYS